MSSTSELAQIEFYFPQREQVEDKQTLVEGILKSMQDAGSISYSGHRDEQSLYENIEAHLGKGDISTYTSLSESDAAAIATCIEETIQKCNEQLPVPTKNFVFVFPYLPRSPEEDVFGGVMGVAPYSCVLHIYLSPQQWSKTELKNTVAHELNHTIFYYHHYDELDNYTLLDQMVIEGLAENFREHVINEEHAPWVAALSRDEAFNVLEGMKDQLSSKDESLHREVLFGSDKYKKWTGYAVGYWLVHEYISRHLELSWEEIIKKEPTEILEVVES